MDPQLAQILEQLAQRFDTTTTYLWQVMVRQARVDAVSYVVQVIVYGLCVWLFVRVTGKLKQRYPDGFVGDESFWLWIAWVFVVAGMGIWIATLVGMLNGFLTAVLNPEYWALQQILDTVKGG